MQLRIYICHERAAARGAGRGDSEYCNLTGQ